MAQTLIAAEVGRTYASTDHLVLTDCPACGAPYEQQEEFTG